MRIIFVGGYGLVKDISVNFPNEILDRFNIEGVIVSPNIPNLGWTFLSEIKNNNIVLRIYIMEKLSENLVFELDTELAVFMFSTQIEMRRFYNQLLNMSALEYMILLKESSSQNFH